MYVPLKLYRLLGTVNPDHRLKMQLYPTSLAKKVLVCL